MLSSAKGNPTALSQVVRDAYRHDARRWICVLTGVTTLLCKISLQFCCEFIDNNRSNIILTRNIARFLKLPTSILYIAHSAFTLQSLIENYKDPKKRQLAKIIGKSANLANSIIEVLMPFFCWLQFKCGRSSWVNINNLIFVYLRTYKLLLHMEKILGQ